MDHNTRPEPKSIRRLRQQIAETERILRVLETAEAAPLISQAIILYNARLAELQAKLARRGDIAPNKKATPLSCPSA